MSAILNFFGGQSSADVSAPAPEPAAQSSQAELKPRRDFSKPRRGSLVTSDYGGPADADAGAELLRMTEQNAANIGIITDESQPALAPTDKSISDIIPWQISKARASLTNAFTGQASAQAAEERAIVKMQSMIRKHMARREFSYLVRRERLILVMMAIEDEKAALVQNIWRERKRNREERRELVMIRKLQALVRGFKVRSTILPMKKMRMLLMRRAARRIQRHTRIAIARAGFKRICRGVIEKQGQIAIPLFGRMELVVWQERYVYAGDRQLCIQKLTKDKKVRHPTPLPSASPAPRLRLRSPPRPPLSPCTRLTRLPFPQANVSTTKTIPYSDVKEVKATLDERLLALVCENKTFKFSLPSREMTEEWATAMLQLINLSGNDVEGYFEIKTNSAKSAIKTDDADVEAPGNAGGARPPPQPQSAESSFFADTRGR